MGVLLPLWSTRRNCFGVGALRREPTSPISFPRFLIGHLGCVAVLRTHSPMIVDRRGHDVRAFELFPYLDKVGSVVKCVDRDGRSQRMEQQRRESRAGTHAPDSVRLRNCDSSFRTCWSPSDGVLPLPLSVLDQHMAFTELSVTAFRSQRCWNSNAIEVRRWWIAADQVITTLCWVWLPHWVTSFSTRVSEG